VCRIVVDGVFRGMGTHFADGWVITSQSVLPDAHAVAAAEFRFDAELRGSHFTSLPNRRALGWTVPVQEFAAVVSVLFVKLGLQRPNNTDGVPRYAEQELLEQQLVKHLRCYNDPTASRFARDSSSATGTPKSPTTLVPHLTAAAVSAAAAAPPAAIRRLYGQASTDLEGGYADYGGGHGAHDSDDYLRDDMDTITDEPSASGGHSVFLQLPDLGTTVRVLENDELPLAAAAANAAATAATTTLTAAANNNNNSSSNVPGGAGATPASPAPAATPQRTSGALYLESSAARGFLGAPLFSVDTHSVAGAAS
jgi:hypothetical protein